MSRPSARLVPAGATTLVSSSPRKRESNGPPGRNGELAGPGDGRKAGRTARGGYGDGSVGGGSYLYRITSVVTHDRPRVVGGRRTRRGRRKRKSQRRDRNSCSGHEEGMNHRKVSTAADADNIASDAARRDGGEQFLARGTVRRLLEDRVAVTRVVARLRGRSRSGAFYFTAATRAAAPEQACASFRNHFRLMGAL